MFDLGMILKELRDENNYTQMQVAKKLNVSVTTVGRWEINYRLPSTQHLIDLSLLYNVPLNYLVGIEKEKSIVIGHLTPKQQNLLITLILEFQSNNSKNSSGLSERQQNILNNILVEFNK